MTLEQQEDFEFGFSYGIDGLLPRTNQFSEASWQGWEAGCLMRKAEQEAKRE